MGETTDTAAPSLPPCPTAAAVSSVVRAGQATALSSCNAALERIAKTESAIHAWCHLDEAAARHTAEALDAAGPTGSLAGVPVGIKDIIDTVDQPTENGTSIDRGRRPKADATVVRRLRDAGALILGKTVTTELACGASRETRNPHDLAHTPGGSSSGSAATIAAGGVPLTLGTQTAGSVVRPAAFCGVWGMKPSYGTIPRTGVMMMSHSLDHVGVFAGSALEIALGIDVISGDDGLDQASVGRAPTRLAAGVTLPLERPRLAFIKDPAWHEVEPDAAAAYEAAAERLGAEALTLSKTFAEAADVQRGIMRCEIAHYLAPWYERDADALSDTARGHILAGREIGSAAYLALLDRANAMRRAFDAAIRPYDAALTPSAPGIAPHGLDFTGSRMQTMLWTLLGVPAINVPALVGDSGLPVGLQIVGRFGSDVATLRAASWCGSRLQGVPS
jgi:Asp-tRNA(Asn)/Glu-tRNA(Gln) amidotransferase A subunit family amidase